MKITNINVLKLVWIICTIFYSSLLVAQPYSGGSNSGSSIGNTVAVNCTSDRYFGGDNDGTGTAGTSLLDCTTIRFSGDTADGGTAAKTNDFNCTPIRFFGDTADGATALATNVLNCSKERFWGDTADGFASAKFLLIRNFLGNDTSVTIICSNETFSLLTLYTTPANLTYSWSSPTPVAAGLGIYQLIATNQSGCVDTALATVKQEIATWNGNVSNNWHDAANWNNGKIPDEKTHVIIPSSTPNPCQISTSDAKAASVQAKSSGSFSIINNRILLISGTCVSLPPN